MTRTGTTRSQVAEILAYLRTLYPNGKPVTELTVSAWYDLLADYPFEAVKLAARNVAKTYTGYTMPAPAEIIEQIDNMRDQNSSIELWRVAEKAIRKGTVITQQEFDELPEEVRIYFGGVSAIKDLALLDADLLPNERARFLRVIPEIRNRKKARAALNDTVMELLEGRL